MARAAGGLSAVEDRWQGRRFRFRPVDLRILAALILLALCARLPLLAIYGPVKAPDSDDYIRYADTILSGILNLQQLASGMAPMTVFRVIGYPAVIAAAKLVAGADWPWLIVGLQTALTFAATVMLYRVMLLLCGSRPWAFAAGLIYSLSMPLVFDQMILTDSLAASLLIFCACWLAEPILTRRPLNIATALSAGLVLAAAFLIREANIYLAGVGILPLAVAAVCADCWPSRPWRLWRVVSWRRTGMLLLTVLPLLVAWQGYRMWNAQRLGVPVVTTAAQTTILQAMAIAAAHDPAVFDRGHIFDRVAAETFTTYSFDEIWKINTRLHDEYGMTADRIASAAYASYFRAWRHHPLAMIWIPLYHVRMSVALSPFQPFGSVRLLHLWATDSALELGTRRGVAEGHWVMLPVFLLDSACRAVALAIFVAFLFGTPWRLVRQGWKPEVVASLGFWALFVAVHTGYAMVHLEPRYLLPTIAGATVIGLFNLCDLWHWYRNRRN